MGRLASVRRAGPVPCRRGVFSVAIGLHIRRVTAITWPLVPLIVGLVCAAFGRPLLLKFLELLSAKWSGTSTDSTNVSITGDAAKMIEAVRKRRDDTLGVEKSGTVPQAFHE